MNPATLFIGAAIKCMNIAEFRKEAILEKLNKLYREHYQCEDGWYSCPLSVEGCSNDQDEGCTCGAERHNHLLDEIKELL